MFAECCWDNVTSGELLLTSQCVLVLSFMMNSETSLPSEAALSGDFSSDLKWDLRWESVLCQGKCCDARLGTCPLAGVAWMRYLPRVSPWHSSSTSVYLYWAHGPGEREVPWHCRALALSLWNGDKGMSSADDVCWGYWESNGMKTDNSIILVLPTLGGSTAQWTRMWKSHYSALSLPDVFTVLKISKSDGVWVWKFEIDLVAETFLDT